MNQRTRPTSLLTAAASLAASLAVCLAGPAQSAPQPEAHASATPPLPLGLTDTPQTSTVRTLQPGLTLTQITRGAPDPATPWVVELSIPSTSTSPDPDAPARSVQDESAADALVTRLADAGFAASAEPVNQPAVADVAAGVIGYRVRLDQRTDLAGAKDAVSRLRSAGFSSRTWYAGWDGGATVNGQWVVNVLTIDPRTFSGQLTGTFGPTLEDRETTTALAAYTRARAAVNAGFFVLDPAAGAPGDPAGVGLYAGQLESETVAGRPALVLDAHARHTQVVRPVWRGTVRVDGTDLALDGLNRVPGLIRNCGGEASDSPTALALHDFTCTDPSERVAFTSAFGASTPTGPGSEVVLDRQDRVVRVLASRGTTLAPGQHSIQATGAAVASMAALAPGQPAHLSLTLQTPAGGTLVKPGTAVINGGPQLLKDGANHITQRADGMVHPGDPSFAYGWVLQRNPRTFAGTDAQGRTLLVTVDGRQVDQLGLSVPEAAAVAQALGMTEAINLDGGGSTAMVVDGALVGHPSDAAGERPVGDAIVIR